MNVWLFARGFFAACSWHRCLTIVGRSFPARTPNGAAQEFRLVGSCLRKPLAALLGCRRRRHGFARSCRGLDNPLHDRSGCDRPLGCRRVVPFTTVSIVARPLATIRIDAISVAAISVGAFGTVGPWAAIHAVATVGALVHSLLALGSAGIAAGIALAEGSVCAHRVPVAISAITPAISSPITAVLSKPLVALPELWPVATTVSVTLLLTLLCVVSVVAKAFALLARPVVASWPVVASRLIEHARLGLVASNVARLPAHSTAHSTAAHLILVAVVAFAVALAIVEVAAKAWEGARPVHAAGQALAAVLLDLLLTIRENDAVVVLGVLEVILGQNMIA